MASCLSVSNYGKYKKEIFSFKVEFFLLISIRAHKITLDFEILSTFQKGTIVTSDGSKNLISKTLSKKKRLIALHGKLRR